MNICKKPWWLKPFISSDMSVTLAPNIYLSDTVYANQTLYNATIEHEKLHVEQQTKMGLTKWLRKYFTDKEFLLDQETKAYGWGLLFYPSDRKASELIYAAKLLTGPSYRNAAPTIEIAKQKIKDAYLLFGGNPNDI